MIQYKTLWVLDKDENGKDANLNLRVKWNNSKCITTFSVGIKVEIAKWSQEAQRCKNNTTHGKNMLPASVINKKLSEYEEKAEKVFAEFGDTLVNVKDFKRAYKVLLGKGSIDDVQQQENSIFPLYDLYCTSTAQINSWTDTTIKNHNTFKSNLLHFNSKLTTGDLTLQTMYDLQAWYVECGYLNSTIRKQIIIFKAFIEWLTEQGYYNGNAHKQFKVKFKGIGELRVVVYLTWHELIKLYEMQFQTKAQEMTRDVFCFCCFTSLRYSDVAKLSKSDVRENEIEVVTEKTNAVLSIDLNKYSKAILDKYKNEPIPNNLALPVPAMQVMNRELKQIGKAAGFDTPIRKVHYSGNKRIEVVKPKYEYMTTHCGRRTFIVNSLYLGIPAEVVMKWTGHADYESMKPYVAIVDELKAREMDKFNHAPTD